MRLLAIFIALLAVSPSYASFVYEFKTDDTVIANSSTTFVGNEFTRTYTGLVADGVTFDAKVTAVGSGDLTLAGGGVGVGEDTSDLVSNGESLQFLMSVANVTGGAVRLDGFTEINFSFLTGTDSATLSEDGSLATVGDNFFTTTSGADIEDISAASPTSFFAFALPGASNSFRVDDVSFQFTGTVPEPSSMAMVAIAAIGYLVVRRRRRNEAS